MPGPDERARGDELNVYLHWSPVEDADGEGPEEEAPKARGLFLGQLPDDPPDDGWTDDLPDSEGFAPDATFETELVEPVEIPAGAGDQSRAPVVDEPIGDATAPVPPVATGPRAARKREEDRARGTQAAWKGSALSRRGRGGGRRRACDRYCRLRRNPGEWR